MKQTRLAQVQKQFRTLLSLDTRDKVLFFEALYFQYKVWFLMLFLPFRKMFSIEDYCNVSEGLTNTVILERTRIAISRADTLAFWKNRCLVKSLAAYRMLKRRGIRASLHLGLSTGQGSMPVAHAWLQVGHFEVVSRGEVEVELFDSYL